MANRNQEGQVKGQGGKKDQIRHSTTMASVNDSYNFSTQPHPVQFVEYLLGAHFILCLFVHRANACYRLVGQVI